MELCLTYDMRAPDFGARRNMLYDAALDQVAWADELGFDLVGLGEHHEEHEHEEEEDPPDTIRPDSGSWLGRVFSSSGRHYGGGS